MCEEAEIVEGIRLNMSTERLRRGLTQAEVARRVGTNPRQVWLWEKGQAAPSGKFIVPLCELYGSDVRYLLHREGMED